MKFLFLVNQLLVDQFYMNSNDIFQQITAIQVESPAEKIMLRLKELITTHQLRPGDRLPSERILSERFGVGRSYVREAILKLEFYGLLKTSPQSGTYVSGYSIKMLDGIFNDIIKFNKNDFAGLIEARCQMESIVVKLAAERRTDQNLADIENALLEYERKVEEGKEAVEEDMFFHLKLASATQNTFFESMMLFLLPDIIRQIVDSKICHGDRRVKAIPEHRLIFQAVQNQDPLAADEAIKSHLEEILIASRAGLPNL